MNTSKYTEIRIHARAGQGAITTAAVIGAAVFNKGKYAYCFPNFGAARMGAPMDAFVRVGDQPVRLNTKVYEPHYVLVMDSTLMRGYDVFAGLRQGGIVIVNHAKEMNAVAADGVKVYPVPANEIALEVLGRPIGNIALVGAFAAVCGLFDLDSLNAAVAKRFEPEMARKNCEAARRGYEFLKGRL